MKFLIFLSTIATVAANGDMFAESPSFCCTYRFNLCVRESGSNNPADALNAFCNANEANCLGPCNPSNDAFWFPLEEDMEPMTCDVRLTGGCNSNDDCCGPLECTLITEPSGNSYMGCEVPGELLDPNNPNLGLPINVPTSSPTTSPVTSPTTSPTTSPVTSPTTSPTASPVTSPTASPVTSPTTSPTTSPVTSPTTSPTASPVTSPTASPVTSPTTSPTTSPVTSPTSSPTTSPVESAVANCCTFNFQRCDSGGPEFCDASLENCNICTGNFFPVDEAANAASACIPRYNGCTTTADCCPGLVCANNGNPFFNPCILEGVDPGTPL